MSQQDNQRFVYWGLNITDIAAVIALIISVWFGIISPLIADAGSPRVDVEFPDTIQFNCFRYTRTDDNSYHCDDDSKIFITADLFSFWNTSRYYVKPEVVKGISGYMRLSSIGDGSNSINDAQLRWQYFTDITDRPEANETNAGRFVVNKGDLKNLEVQFTVDERVRWSHIEESIDNGKIAYITFDIDLAHNTDKRIRCAVELSRLRDQLPSYVVIDRDVACRPVSSL